LKGGEEIKGFKKNQFDLIPTAGVLFLFKMSHFKHNYFSKYTHKNMPPQNHNNYFG